MPTLKVFVNEATNLFGADIDGNSDPYCVLKIGEGNQFSAIEKTRKIKNTKNPTWKECFTLNVNNPLTESLFLEVWNKETMSKDDSLGYAQIPLNDLQRNVEKQVWIQLEGGTTGTNIIGSIASKLGKKKGEKTNHGKVFLGLTALDFGIDPNIAQQQFQQGIGMQQGGLQQGGLPGMGMQQGGMPGMGMQQGVPMQQGIGMQHGGMPGMGMQQGGIPMQQGIGMQQGGHQSNIPGQHHEGHHHEGQFHEGQHHEGHHHEGQFHEGQHHEGQHHEGQFHEGQHHEGQGFEHKSYQPGMPQTGMQQGQQGMQQGYQGQQGIQQGMTNPQVHTTTSPIHHNSSSSTHPPGVEHGHHHKVEHEGHAH